MHVPFVLVFTKTDKKKVDHESNILAFQNAMLEEWETLVYDSCTLCGRCVEFCPDKGVLKLQYTVFPVFSADPKYFKRRKKAQTQWDKLRLFKGKG